MSATLKEQLASVQEYFETIRIHNPSEGLAQGSSAWLAARVGKSTASRIDEVVALKQPSAEQAKAAGFKLVREAMAAGLTGGSTEARDRYMIELVAERLTGVAIPHYVSEDMEKGTENEPLSRAAYEFAKDCEVDQIGFVNHPSIPMYGASPDGTIGEDGLLELKNPRPTTHLRWMRAGVIPPEHVPQMMAQLSCMPDRKWNDFTSYCAGVRDPNNPDLVAEFPEHLKLFTVRLMRDDAAIADMESKVRQFLDEVDEQMRKLEAYR